MSATSDVIEQEVMDQTAVGRKRSVNVPGDSMSHNSELANDSPLKRPCLRELENDLKPDTPAIPGIKSRLKDLSSRYQDQDENNGETISDSIQKTDAKPIAKEEMADVDTGHIQSTNRSGRFSALANSINNWEDDLKHVVIKDGLAWIEMKNPLKEEAKPPTAAARLRTMNAAPKLAPIEDQPAVVSASTSSVEPKLSAAPRDAISTTCGESSSVPEVLKPELNLSLNSLAGAAGPSAVDRQPIKAAEHASACDIAVEKPLPKSRASASEFEAAGSISHGFGVDSRLPSVSERLAGWQKKVEGELANQTPQRPSVSGGEESGRQSAVRSRVSMWQQRVSEEQLAATSGGKVGGVLAEYRASESESQKMVVEALVEKENESKVELRVKEAASAGTTTPVAGTTPAGSVPARVEPTPRVSILGLVRKQAKPVSPSVDSQQNESFATPAAESVTLVSASEAAPSKMTPVVEVNEAIQLKVTLVVEPALACVKISPKAADVVSSIVVTTGEVKSVGVAEQGAAQVGGSTTADVVMTSGGVDGGEGNSLSGADDVFSVRASENSNQEGGEWSRGADVVSLSSSAAMDLEIARVSSSSVEEGEDEEGVFELLDDAIGDSSSCASQRSDDKSEHDTSVRTYRTATPPSDGTSISSSQISSTGRTITSRGSAEPARAAVELSGGSDAIVLRRHNSSDAKEFGEIKKQTLRATSDGFLLDDRDAVDAGGDKRATYIADTRLGSSSGGGDHYGTTRSLDDVMERPAKSRFEARPSISSAARHHPVQNACCDTRAIEGRSPTEQIKLLQDLVAQEQSVIAQTSNALTQCCHASSAFVGSEESVECHRHLLVASKKQNKYQQEIARLSTRPTAPASVDVARGNVILTDLLVPLRAEFLSKLDSGDDVASAYFLVMISCDSMAYFSPMASARDVIKRGMIDVVGTFQFFDLSPDFKLKVEIFAMEVQKEPQTPKKRKGLTPKKLLRNKSPGRRPDKSESTTGVRGSDFQLAGFASIGIDASGKTLFRLDHVQPGSALQGTIQTKIECCMASGLEERGFLTLFEDVNGFGAWHRRWCLLNKDALHCWKYPDDEKTKESVGVVDLKLCVTGEVGAIPRDFCARPNTFELVTSRRQRRGETNSLVSTCANNIVTTKHWWSADTKEERVLWCDRLNLTLHNLRLWHKDTMPTAGVSTN